MKLFLAGEGPTELGGFADPAPYRSAERGLLIAFAERVATSELSVHDATLWKNIRKYKVGGHRNAEERNVLGLVLRAEESGAELVVFSRDRDGDLEREVAVESGYASALNSFPKIRIAGGTANEAIEAWLLAVLGEKASESHRRPKTVLAVRYPEVAQLSEQVRVIDDCDIGAIDADAASLHRWVDRLRTALNRKE
ncbi:MAG: hypothetical protein HY791_09430 [Deltaproteobacteria bacterium]|nr:hypothetical protein [Deltaproteobacteria bacterium]